eukprot:TRINITY_DN7197_c0_g1_i2.p1 TRINITY_DN7197_c0_g1~~TRINITY_DN7197_c0_g1_i2.p1  ORF type:complete len:187 (+),score=4.66 TRINITY_DN7197_c0_g1_i2:151-711(+)
MCIRDRPYILKLWLKTVPENTIIFCRLVLVLSLFQQLSVGLMAAVTSVGKIKIYQILMGSLLLLNLPIAFVLIKLGFPAYSVLASSIFIEIAALGSRIWLTYKITGLNINEFVKIVVINSVICAILALLFALTPRLFLDESILRAFLSTLISITTLFLLALLTVFSSDEKQKLRMLFMQFVKKFNR